jgi:hypothetical protein
MSFSVPGQDLENMEEVSRTGRAFLTSIVEGIKAEAPGMEIGSPSALMGAVQTE